VAPRRLIDPAVLYRLDRRERLGNPRRFIADRKGGRVVESSGYVRGRLPQRGGAVQNVRPDCSPKLALLSPSRIQLAGGNLELCDRLSQRLYVGVSDRWILMRVPAALLVAHTRGLARTPRPLSPQQK